MDFKIEGLIHTPQKRIATTGGDILRVMRNMDPEYTEFGEAYFSFVGYGFIKGWKRHQEITINLIVPVGKVRFVFYDDRVDSKTIGVFDEMISSPDHNYGRITIPPLIWFAFCGLGTDINLVLSITDKIHDPGEIDRLEINEIEYVWS